MVVILQSRSSDSSRITITSTGSKIRVADGVDIIQKFEGIFAKQDAIFHS